MRIFFSLVVLVGASAAFSPLEAYTDPGSGLLLWQSLVGAFVGVSFLFRKHLGRLFQRSDSKPEATESKSQGSTSEIESQE